MKCQHCDAPIPAGSRRDRVYCNRNCSALASYYRRKRGAAPPPRWQHPALESGNPALRAAAGRARQLSKTHGWSPSTLRCALDGLMVLLDGRPAGERVTLTEIRARAPRHTSTPRVAEVLAGLGLLEDDSIPAVRSWIERRAGELQDGFAAAVRAWLLVLLDGDTRARPRSHASSFSSVFHECVVVDVVDSQIAVGGIGIVVVQPLQVTRRKRASISLGVCHGGSPFECRKSRPDRHQGLSDGCWRHGLARQRARRVVFQR